VDELGLQSFLRGYNEEGFGSSSADSTQEVALTGLIWEHVCLDKFVGSEADLILWDGEEQKGRVTLIQTQKSVTLNSVAHNTDGSHLVFLRIKLHDSLCELSWVRD